MRIGIVRREYITHLDGVNRFCAHLAEGLRRLDHEAFIVSWGFYGVDEERLPKCFAKVHGLDGEIPIYTIEEEPRRGDPWAKILFDWWFKGSRLLRRLGVDVVVVNGVVPLRFEPKVAVAHGVEALGSLSPLRKTVLKFLYNLYDYVICVSETTEEMYKEITKCSEKIPIPLKLDLWKSRHLSEREDLIVHVGTRRIKNPQISFEAVKILRERGFHVRILFIGPRTDIIESLMRRYDFVENQLVTSARKMAEILSKAKALILPSSREGLPYSVLEAMASGTPPVVSSAVLGDVVIDGFNGVRVNSFDPVDYANALEKLLRDEDFWLKLSKNGVEFVKRFDYIEVARRYENIFRRRLHES